MSERIRVLVVDDSALMRKLIPAILSRDPSLEVVGTAMDGAFALKKIAECQPDVITLDLEMPRMDGIEALRQITSQAPVPVIVFSAHSKQGAYCTFQALALGAIDFVAKPGNAAAGDLETIAAELIEKIKIARRAGAHANWARFSTGRAGSHEQKKAERPWLPANRVIAIGVSTGGPNALQLVLSQLPANFPGSIVVAQHMPEGFTEMFARRLDETCALEVREARSGDLLTAGRVLIAPGNRHLTVRHTSEAGTALVSDRPHVNGHRPSVDVLFQSVAAEFDASAVGVLMTGMGEDGAEGLGAIRAAGGFTIAQSEESCVVSGMPRAAIAKGYVDKIVALDDLGSVLASQCGVEGLVPEVLQKLATGGQEKKTEKKDESQPVSSRRS
jgi:two-component system chemotaxis response regulator CheB